MESIEMRALMRFCKLSKDGQTCSLICVSLGCRWHFRGYVSTSKLVVKAARAKEN